MDKQVDAPVQSQSWCVEWFGSQGDFIAGKAKEPISLSRFGGLESLYAIGPLERGRGEVSIYDFSRRAAFLVYAIVENWRRVTLRKLIDGEQQLEEQLLPFAVESGIDVDLPFPFLIHCHITQATFHVLRNQSEGEYSPEVHEKAKVRFPIIDQSVEIIGFYSRRHRGVFTPLDSDFHRHVITLDNQLSGLLEIFSFSPGMMLYLPTNER